MADGVPNVRVCSDFNNVKRIEVILTTEAVFSETVCFKGGRGNGSDIFPPFPVSSFLRIALGCDGEEGTLMLCHGQQLRRGGYCAPFCRK